MPFRGILIGAKGKGAPIDRLQLPCEHLPFRICFAQRKKLRLSVYFENFLEIHDPPSPTGPPARIFSIIRGTDENVKIPPQFSECGRSENISHFSNKNAPP